MMYIRYTFTSRLQEVIAGMHRNFGILFFQKKCINPPWRRANEKNTIMDDATQHHIPSPPAQEDATKAKDVLHDLGTRPQQE